MEMTRPHDPAIRVRNLTVAFSGVRILDNLSLDIAHGRLTMLLGRSGSGKTTFLRSLNRLNECFEECSTSGEVHIRLDGRLMDIHGPDMEPESLRRRAGMVFQSPNVLPASIGRNLSLPLKLVLGAHKSEIPDRSRKALVEAGLWDEVRDRLHDPASTLSGGQQQRLCLARTLALEPDILLLDEPTASLDFKASRTIEEMLERLKGRYSMVVVSHSLNQARRLGDEFFIFRESGQAAPISPESFTDPDALAGLMEEML